jgi:hypothetical protein
MRLRLFLLLCAVVLAGCASGPKFSEIQSSLPALKPELGRIFFYRSSVLGAAIQPNILVNGDVVGEMVPMGFFFVDRSPGNYLVSAATEAEATLPLSLEPNQTQYVRGSISFGAFVGRPSFTLVDSMNALNEMQDLGYVGSTGLHVGAMRATAPPDAPVQALADDSSATLKDLEGLLTGKAVKK